MPDQVIIVGGGFAGAVTALRLAETVDPPDVTIVEPRQELGRGIAYSTADLDHLVNGPARLFGVHPGDVDHLPRWLADHPDRRGWVGPRNGDFAASFPPRILYGDYVQSQLGTTKVRHEVESAIDITAEGDVALASGRRLRAKRIVLATGLARNEAGFRLPEAVRTSGRYIGDPWAAAAYEGIEKAEEVAIIGSGLTMLDIVISLEKRGFRGRYVVFSRRGLLVRSRRDVEPWPVPGLEVTLPRSALGLFRWIRHELRTISAAGDDWQRLVLALRPHVEALWAGADDRERRRFARHLRSFWDLAFHRAVPDSIAWLDRVRAQGRFVNLAGRAQALEMATDGGVRVIFRPRGAKSNGSRRFDHVVNAAGYDADWRRVPNVLARNLVAGGQVRPHAVGFGIDADPGTGAVIAADGRVSRHLYAVGHPLRGAAWEASSIVEQLEGAARVARALSGGL
jgi:uncharacterized NAD(P)/FAD-binding protein YdhS